MKRPTRRRNNRTRSRADKEVRTTDVPIDVCTDVVRRVLADSVGDTVEEPTTGYFRWAEGSGASRVRYTLRTYAAVPGTRITLEGEADVPAWLLALLALLLLVTAGLAVLFIVPLLANAQSERRREVRVFECMRAIDLALTPSGGSYRVAPGALMHAPPAKRMRVAATGMKSRDADEEGEDDPRASGTVKLGRRS